MFRPYPRELPPDAFLPYQFNAPIVRVGNPMAVMVKPVILHSPGGVSRASPWAWVWRLFPFKIAMGKFWNFQRPGGKMTTSAIRQQML